MPSFGQFELLEPIRIAAVETWLARERNSERTLLLHKFSRDSGLRERLLSMRPQDLIMLMRAGEENGVCFVVTYDTPDLRDFARWVEEHAAPAEKPVPASSPEPQPAPSTTEPGEFTRLFQTPAAPARPSQPQRPIPAEPSLEPGDFTRVFQAPNAAPSQPQRPASVQASSEQGEFTRMFQAPAVSSPQPQSPSPIKATNEPGDFTKFFSNPLPDSTLPQALDKPPAELPAVEPPREPGDFTRHFGPRSFAQPIGERVPPPMTPAPQPAWPQPPANGSATGVFSAPQHGTPVTSNSNAGPGEYTRMFDRPPAPAQPAAPPAARAAETNTPAAAPIARRPNYTPLVLILSVLALVALALILYFLLHR